MPAVLVAVSMLGTSLLGIRSINRLQAQRDKIVSEHVSRLETAQDIETYLRHIRFHSFVYVMDMTPARWAKVEKDQNDFAGALTRMRESARDDEELRIIEAIDAGYLRYRQELENTARSPPGPDRSEFLAWSDAHPIRYVVEPCEELLAINRRAMTETAAESAREGDRTRTRMILLGGLGAAGGLIGGFGVAWGLSRSITRLRIRLQDVDAQLDRTVASVRLSAGDGNLPELERQVGSILDRVRMVVDEAQRQERESLRAEQLAAVGQLAAGMAHEVRNPLTSIKLLVGAAMHDGRAAGLSDTDLRVIHDEVGRLERKVEALLDFARPRGTTPEPADVGRIVRQVADLIGVRLRQQNIELKLDLPSEPVALKLDRDQFNGVVLNLLLNALDAMPGGGELTVTLGRAVDGTIVLTVADTGGGISAAVGPRLFDPFFSTKSTGTGLGLNVARRVVESHGGSLTAANRAGGGACFTVSLPAGGPSDADAPGRG
jgi:signal transduction histidine kinase